MWRVGETREIKTGFLWGGLMGRNHSEDVGVDGRIKFKWLFKR
jgi:hypothetical protein